MTYRYVTVAVALVAASCLAVGCGGAEDAARNGDLKAFAHQMQSGVFGGGIAYDADGRTLEDLGAEADLTGTGEIVDVRPGFSLNYNDVPGDTDLEPHLLVEIEPTEVDHGDDLLGTSGSIFVDIVSPEAIVPVADVRAAAVTNEPVVFMLREITAGFYEIPVVNEFAGRASDDPIFVPEHASTWFGVDTSTSSAFPILTDEVIECTEPNLDAMAAAGTPVESFSIVTEDPALTGEVGKAPADEDASGTCGADALQSGASGAQGFAPE